MRIAWFTPFASQSAIGRYSQIVVEELSRTDEVEIFAPRLGRNVRPHPSPVRTHWIDDKPHSDLIGYLPSFDVAVYNLGNHLGNHRAIREYARVYPGVIVLHDLMMRDFWCGLAMATEGTPDAFYDLHDLFYPERDARGTFRAEDWLRYPLFEPFLLNALGAIVHSKFARDAINAVSPVTVSHIDFPRDPRFPHAADSRRKVGTVRLLTFGHVNRNKLVHAVIECLGQNPDLAQAVEYDILGPVDPSYLEGLTSLVHRHQLESRVHFLGPRSDAELRERLAACHIAVNLRVPHFGESSWSLIEAMFSGLPCVVWNHGYYAEFPNDCVAKVSSLPELAETLKGLVRKRRRREAMGQAALEHTRERFQTSLYCKRFLELAERVRGERPFWLMAGRVGEYLNELHVRPEDVWTHRIADELARLRGDTA